jgi:hypothetical protein
LSLTLLGCGTAAESAASSSEEQSEFFVEPTAAESSLAAEMDGHLFNRETSFTIQTTLTESEMVDMVASRCELVSIATSLSYKVTAYGYSFNVDYLDYATDTSSKASTLYGESVDAAASYLAASSYTEAVSSFAVDDYEETFECVSSEQLWYGIMNGKKPVISAEDNPDLYALYVSIRTVASSIFSDKMTEYEKALAVYDWLSNECQYDHEAAELSSEEENPEKRDCFFLEGVFNRHLAVCDGFSKAYVVLGALGGLDVRRVTGTMDGGGHAWDYVSIGGCYYASDPTAGNTALQLSVNGDTVSYGMEVGDHSMFLCSNATLEAAGYRQSSYILYEALYDSDYYFDKATFSYDGVDGLTLHPTDASSAFRLIKLLYESNGAQGNRFINVRLTDTPVNFWTDLKTLIAGDEAILLSPGYYKSEDGLATEYTFFYSGAAEKNATAYRG